MATTKTMSVIIICRMKQVRLAEILTPLYYEKKG